MRRSMEDYQKDYLKIIYFFFSLFLILSYNQILNFSRFLSYRSFIVMLEINILEQ